MIAAEELVRGQRRFGYEKAARVTGADRKARVAGRILRADRRVAFLVGLVIFAAICFTFTFRSLSAVREGYQMGAMQSQVAQLKRENEALQLQLAQAQSLDQIRLLATTKLKMKEPEQYRVASVSGSGNSYAYGYRSDLSTASAPGSAASGGPVIQTAAVAQPETVALAGVRASFGRGERALADLIHRLSLWFTAVREVRANSWD